MNQVNKHILEQLKHKLIVSCQARVGWPMYGPEIMAAFAAAAKQGGAAGIRATGADNILKIKERVDLPIIGINKQFYDGYDVYITPSYESAREFQEIGVEIRSWTLPRENGRGARRWSISWTDSGALSPGAGDGEISRWRRARAAYFLWDSMSFPPRCQVYRVQPGRGKSVNLELIRQIHWDHRHAPLSRRGKILGGGRGGHESRSHARWWWNLHYPAGDYLQAVRGSAAGV